ncbi:MAG: hypothetical protein LUF87_11510 [Alistipes sp.]|nr:hypothetical protein [Alistipes sp.]
MKKFFYLLPALALVFAACSDSDDDNGDDGNGGGLGDGYTLTVKSNEIANAPTDGEIDKVKLISYESDVAILTTDWEDGFLLDFPETVSSSNLEKVAEAFVIEEDEFKISDPDARISGFYIEGYKGDLHVDTFYFLNSTEEQEIRYYYSDRDVTVTGEVKIGDGSWEYVEKYDLALTKGWNRVLTIEIIQDDYESLAFSSNVLSTGFSWKFGRDFEY